MAIIKQTDWQPPVTTTFTTLQRLGENPVRAYRELLMAEDANGDPIPYRILGSSIIRVPYGMAYANPATVNQSRVPDVVIPIVVTNLTYADPPTTGAIVCPVWVPTPPVPLLHTPSTGMWVDENYIYLAVVDSNPFGSDPVDFIVYVEYTHSIIRNEVITGDYALASSYIRGAGGWNFLG